MTDTTQPVDQHGQPYTGTTRHGPKFDDGGPATDKTLHDWFAGQALAGIGPLMLALYDRIKPPDGEPLTMPEVIARLALETADAMIAEKRRREKGQ